MSDQTGVVPILELWGHGALNSLADCAHIVIGSGHPKATMLLDFYHLYRGGNDWDTLDCINGSRLSLIHINDYPADPPFDQLRDSLDITLTANMIMGAFFRIDYYYFVLKNDGKKVDINELSDNFFDIVANGIMKA